MVVFVLMLAISIAISAVIMLYVAYPYRGLETPYKPEVGEKLREWVDALPILPPEEEDEPEVARPDHYRGAA